MERQEEAASRPSGQDENDRDDDSSIEEIEGDAAGAEAEAAGLDDFLLLLDDADGADEDGFSSVDPRPLALFADVDAGTVCDANINGDEEEGGGETIGDPFSDAYRGPGAIAAASPFAEGCLSLLRAFAKSKELSRRCRAVATAVIERVNPADYTAWKLRWECSRALSSGSSPSATTSSSSSLSLSFLAEEARLCARVAARSGFKNYQLWNHRAKIIGEAAAAERGGNGGGGGGEGGRAAATRRVAEAELSFASAALSDDAKNYHAWSHRCLVAGLLRSVPLWAAEREFSGEAIEEDPGSNSAWAHRAAAVGALVELFPLSSSSSSPGDSTEAMLEEEFALASRHARERPHAAGPAWAHARAVAGWKEAAAGEGNGEGGGEGGEGRRERRSLALPLASDPRYALLAAAVLGEEPGCVPALLLLHDAHALRALWAAAAAAASKGGGEEAAAKAAEEAASSSEEAAAACRARLVEADPTRRGLWSSIG